LRVEKSGEIPVVRVLGLAAHLQGAIDSFHLGADDLSLVWPLGHGSPPSARFCCRHLRSCLRDRLEGARLRSTAANVAVQEPPNFRWAWVRMGFQECNRRHDEPRSAEAAHQAIAVDEGFLNGVELSILF